VRNVAKQLCERGLLPWLDEIDLQPGRSWQEQIEKQIKQIKSAAVFIGPKGSGRWQKNEMRAILDRFAHMGRPVIPVILPNGPEPHRLPVFLQGYHVVRLAESVPDPIDQLE